MGKCVMRHQPILVTLRRRLLMPLLLVAAVILVIVQLQVPGGIAGAATMWRAINGDLILTAHADDTTASLNTPDNVKIALYAEDLVMPRFMVATASGSLIVTHTTTGEIRLLRDSNGDNRADSQTVLLANLDTPQGLVLDNQQLFFSEANKISRVTLDPKTALPLEEPVTLIEQLPAGSPFWSHNTKPLGLSPNGRLHYTIGSPCNACRPDDPRFSTMESIKPDGSDRQTVAMGLRNSIGMDWTPWSGQLYATENARDLLGDNLPNDELNLIEHGEFYGWPYFYTDARLRGLHRNTTVRDSDHRDIDISHLPEPTAPAFAFNAHNAPLGIHFLRHSNWAQAGYPRTALVALHGSWNRSQLDGYKVVALQWGDDGRITASDFITGFFSAEGIIGRPTAFAEDRHGNVYLSDDGGGRIYKISLAE